MQSDAAGNPVLGEDERVEIMYRPGGKPYRASPRNLDSVADALPVDDAALAGKPAVITRHGKPVAKIVPYEEPVADLSIFDAHRGTLPKGFKFDRDELNSRR